VARTEIVEFKVDAEEKQRLRAFAQERGEPLGTYVRKAALSFPEYGKTPISYETQHERENKAKVRKAVENEESYEVKVEAGTIRPNPNEDELRDKAKKLVTSKGLPYRVAYARVLREEAGR